MRNSMRIALAALAGAAVLGGCAAGPYYGNDYGYGYGYEGYGAPGPYYGYPGYGYVEPSVGVGIGFSGVERFDGDRHHHEWHGRRGDWHRDGDRDGDHHH